MMTPTELSQAILEYIRDEYESLFIGKLIVKEMNPGYKVEFYLNNSEYPLVIMSDLEEEQFLNFIKRN